MLDHRAFVEATLDAYQHLYDMVHLRSHVLLDILVPDTDLARKERVWQLHHGLVSVIDELDPGPRAPVDSSEWRRHRLMLLRYVDGLAASAVAEELAISRRHFYREHDEAVKAVVEILWQRHVLDTDLKHQKQGDTYAGDAVEQLELVKSEANRVAQTDPHLSVNEALQGVQSLLRSVASKQQIDFQWEVEAPLPPVAVDRNALRQILLGLSGHLIAHPEITSLALAARKANACVRLIVSAEPLNVYDTEGAENGREQLASFYELARLNNIVISPMQKGHEHVRFALDLPLDSQRTLLIVDDNEDMLELFLRYLAPHEFRVLVAQGARAALSLALREQPDAMIVDLMMPEHDGWDLLQMLQHQEQIRTIPVIVCSVLQQEKVALSLGASAFLPKPVKEESLLTLLDSLQLR